MTKNCSTCGEPHILERDIRHLYSQRCIECILRYGQEPTRLYPDGQEPTMWYPEGTIPVVDEERLS